MLTLPAAPAVLAGRTQDDRPGYRPYAATVVAVERLTPHFVRVTFAGEHLPFLATATADQRVKIMFPSADGRLCDLGQSDADLGEGADGGSWHERWRALPDVERNAMRTYTIRAVRPEAGELDVVFVAHDEPAAAAHDAGPAARWLRTVAPGDRAVVVGPDSRSRHCRTGIDWHPGDARRVLIAGDETAAPAVCAILETLPPWVRATALVEVPTAADALRVAVGGHVDLRWLPREGAVHGDPLTAAVRSWLGSNRDLVARASTPRPQPLPDLDVDRELLWDSPERAWGRVLYAWLAGEAGVIKTLRRELVTEHGIDRRRVAFMGYWRRGRAERTS